MVSSPKFENIVLQPKTTRISETSDSDPEDRKTLLNNQKFKLNQEKKSLKESKSVEALRRKTREVKQKIDAVLLQSAATDHHPTKSSKVVNLDKKRSNSLTNEK